MINILRCTRTKSESLKFYKIKIKKLKNYKNFNQIPKNLSYGLIRKSNPTKHLIILSSHIS